MDDFGEILEGDGLTLDELDRRLLKAEVRQLRDQVAELTARVASVLADHLADGDDWEDD